MQTHSKVSNDDMAFLAVAGLFQISILYSVFLLSLSMFCMGFLAMWSYRKRPMRLISRLRDYWHHPVWWIISLHFVIVLVSGYYSDDTQFWLTRLRLKAPFLLLPMAFFVMPKISMHCYRLLFFSLVMVMSVSTLPVLTDIVGNFGMVQERLLQGQAVEVPGNHIRYSLLVSIASVAGFYLWHLDFRHRYDWEPKLLLALSAYLFVFSHLLAVRSGLVTLYFAFAGVLLFLILKDDLFRRRNLVILLLLIASPMVAVSTLPSLRNKIEYTMEDFQKFREGQETAYSDAERLLSWQGGLKLIRENPWWGVGAGDLRYEMKVHFREAYNMPSYLLPHNQYISIWAGGGVVAMLMFGLALLIPLWKCRQDALFMIVNGVVLISMLVENTLESSMGIAIYIFYLGCALHVSHYPTNADTHSLSIEASDVRQYG